MGVWVGRNIDASSEPFEMEQGVGASLGGRILGARPCTKSQQVSFLSRKLLHTKTTRPRREKQQHDCRSRFACYFVTALLANRFHVLKGGRNLVLAELQWIKIGNRPS